MTRLIYFLTALLLAAIAQRWLSEGGATPRDSLFLFLAGGALFAATSTATRAWPHLPPRRKWPYLGLGLTAAGALLAVIATLGQFWSGVYDGWGLWVWLAAIPLYAAGAWLDLPSPNPAAEAKAENAWQERLRDRRLALIVLALIIVLAAAVRFYALDTYPNGCQSDECNNGLDALKWLSGAPYTPYAETNEGQATLFTYLIALSIRLFGQSVHSMRMVSALAGTLTVLAFYYLSREIYGERIGLLTAALVAVDRWHLTFSRIVYELILMPLVLSLQALFLIKALKSGRRRWWTLSGMMLALGMNTYTAYRVVPFFFAAYFLYWLLTHRQRIRRDFEGMLVFAGGAAVAVAPLGAYTIRNWNVFVSRINHISIFRDVEAANSYAPLWSNLRKTLYMFNWQGDVAALNNLPGAPLLHAIIGVLFVLGIIWALRWFWKELPFFYLLWFGAVASVAVLSVAHEAPTARRPIGLVPVIYLLVGAVFHQLWQSWVQTWGEKRQQPMAIGLSALVVLVIFGNVNTYFRVQAVDPAVWGAYSPNESAVGKYLATVPRSERIFMTPQYTHHSAVKFIGGPHDITPLNLAQHIPLRQDPGADVLFILEPVDERLVPLLQQLYPSGEYQVHRDRYGRTLFLSYRIPRKAYDAARGLQASYSPAGDQPMPPTRGEQVHVIDFDYSLNPPLPPPFRALFEGALLAPQYGAYTFELEAEGGEALLYLDDVEVMRANNGVASIQRTLAGGFQGLRIEYLSGETPGILRLRWATPQNPQLAAIGEEALYSLPGASNGLVGYYYPTSDWSGPPSLIQRDLFILPNNILREPFSIRWKGKVAAPLSGNYIFGARSDDGSLVYVDGQLVVDNSGAHGAEYREGIIQLQEGFHDIEVLYNELGGSREMQLWWQPPGGRKGIIPSAYLYPVEEELPEGLELPPPPTVAPAQPPAETPPASGIQAQPELSPLPATPLQPLGEFTQARPDVLWTYGACGSGKEQLQRPIGVAVDDEGFIYVADMGNNRVVRLSPAGDLVTSWGQKGEGPGQFTEVFDIAITPTGEVAVLDAVNQVISLWSADGKFHKQIGADLATYRPRGFGVAPTGDFFIADTGGVRVLQVGPDGQLVNQFGGADQDFGPGQPTDAVVGADGMVYVVEPISGILWQLDPISGRHKPFTGPEANTIESPHLAASQNGRIYLTDAEGGRVLVFGNNLEPYAQIGERGVEPGQFSRPVGIAVAPDGSIFVSDPDLCRITAFSALP